MQIRTLTVGDTTFLVNPKEPVQYIESSFTKRPTQNFIELTQIAPGKVYSLELITEQSTAEPFTVVTKVAVNNGKFTDGDGACILQGTDRKTFTQGDKKNLDVRLTVTGYPKQDSDDDEVNYVCEYTADLEIFNGGTGWQVGDTFVFEDLGGTGEDYNASLKKSMLSSLLTVNQLPQTRPQQALQQS